MNDNWYNLSSLRNGNFNSKTILSFANTNIEHDLEIKRMPFDWMTEETWFF